MNRTLLSQRTGVAPSKIRTAFDLFARGDLARAADACRVLLRDQPDHFDAMHLLGVILLQSGYPDQAIEQFDRAGLLQPHNSELRSNRRAAVGQRNGPRLAVALKLHGQGKLAAAEPIYKEVLELDPDNFEALQLLGALNGQRKQYAAAIEYLDRALQLRSDRPEVHNNRGNALKELKRLDESLASYDKALALDPDYADAHLNRGNALRELRRHEEALSSYGKAMTLRPKCAEAFDNRGVVLMELGRLDEALMSFDTAIALRPDFAEPYWNKSLALLLTGDLDAGWALHEWRWKTATLRASARHFEQPLWLGDSPLRGRTILLHAEQGLGDTIQFCRYCALAAQQGARVILQVPQMLTGLLARLDGVHEVIATGAPVPSVDCHCPLLSLPLAFRTELANIPTPRGYLAAKPELRQEWEHLLGARRGRPRVGLAWSGSLLNVRLRHRSIAFAEFLTCLPPGVDYVCLQKELPATDREALERHGGVRLLGDRLTDFEDTAAVCELMDAIVCVDTSVAHLAGALGKRTFLLLTHIPDWRWQLDQSDSPWYGAITLFRQPAPGEWAVPLAQVRERIELLLSGSQDGAGGGRRITD